MSCPLEKFTTILKEVLCQSYYLISVPSESIPTFIAPQRNEFLNKKVDHSVVHFNFQQFDDAMIRVFESIFIGVHNSLDSMLINYFKNIYVAGGRLVQPQYPD